MVRSLGSAAVGWACVGVCLAGLSEARAGNAIRQLKLDETAAVVELFDGIESGQFQAKLVAKSAHEASVFIKNTTDAPLTVSLPKAAIGVHILPQVLPVNPFGNNVGNNLGNNFGNNLNQGLGQGNGQDGRSQTIGGQFQPFGNQQGFPNQLGNNPAMMGNGMFSIPPEKTVQLKMRTVCLNYGSPDPHVGLTYELRKLESVVSNPVLRQLLEDYSPRVHQDAMQAAAWHLANGLSWRQIANLPNPGALGVAAMFNGQTLKSAQALVQQAEERAQERAKEEPKPAEGARVLTVKATVK